jgi:hypothetical protein
MKEIYKFVQHEVPSIESIKDAKAVKLRMQLNRGQAITRQDKNWLTEQVNSNSYFRNAVPVMGWCVEFEDVLRCFIIKQYGEWREMWATDKTAIRHITFGRIEEIVRLNK